MVLHAAAPATAQPVNVAAENSSLFLIVKVTVAVPFASPSSVALENKYIILFITFRYSIYVECKNVYIITNTEAHHLFLMLTSCIFLKLHRVLE